MSKLVLNTIGSGYGATALLNQNFDAIEAAIENTLSRDGTTPNEMEANLDMNDNSILNVDALDVASLTINGTPVQPSTGVTVASAFQSYTFTATAGQTSFSVSPYTPYVASVLVEVNGLSLPPAEISVSGTNVVIPACSVGDEVVIRRYTDAPSPFPSASDISFNQAGTIQTRTVQSKLRDVVSVKDFGAVGDNSTNDAAAVQAAIDYVNSIGGGEVTFGPGQTYRLITAPVVKTNVRLNLNGSTINLKFASGSDVVGFDMRDYSAIYNGTINVVADGAPTSSDKDLHCPVVVGKTGASLAGYTGVRISDLVITTNRGGTIGGRGILVQSASNDVIIENIRFPDSANLGSGVQISWAGPGGSPPATSEHPFNVTVRNIRFGTMTKAGASFDVSAIDLVGCYNVTVENVYVDRWAGDAVVQIRSGGFGDTVAPATIKPLLFKNIVVRNISAKQCDQHCVLINGRANDAVGTPANSIPVLVQNIKGVGAGLSSTYAGVRLLHVFDAIIDNCEMEQFDRGVYIEERAKRITIRNGRYFKNNESGVLIVSGATNPEEITVQGVESYLNGQDGTSKAGFEVEACDRVRFIDCTAGDATSETTQIYGFRVQSSASNTKFSGVNRVRNIKVGGAKYLFSAAVYGDRQFCGGSNAALDTASNRYAPIVGVGLSTSEVDSSVNSGGTTLLLTNFRCKLTAAPGGAASFGLRIIDDGVATPLEVSIAGTSTTANDFDSVEVAAGSELSVQTLPSGTPASSRGKWSTEVIFI